MKNKILAFLFTPFLSFAGIEECPFDYDLHLFSLPGINQRTMICFHGYGDNYQLATVLLRK